MTSGPVGENITALPEVSRRSPLAGWKMLVRAIEAFYQDDDEACRRGIQQIPADAAAHRLAPCSCRRLISPLPHPVRLRFSSTHSRRRQDIARGLRRFRAGDGGHRLESRHLRDARRDGRLAASRPDAAECLQQHIHVRCAIEGFPDEDVL